MKKLIILLTLSVFLLSGVGIYADIVKIGEMREFVGDFEANLILSMEGLIDWSPVNEGEFEAEVSEEYRLGNQYSDTIVENGLSSDSYHVEYYYNDELGMLMQICYKNSGKIGYLKWDNNYNIVDYWF